MTIGAINRGDLVLIRADDILGLYVVTQVDLANSRVRVRPLGDEPQIRDWSQIAVPLSAIAAVYAASSTAS